MKFLPTKSTGRARMAKKPGKTNPKKEGPTMAKRKHKKRNNPKRKHYAKRHNPVKAKRHYKKRHNPSMMKMFSTKGLVSAAVSIAVVTAAIVVVSKVFGKVKLRDIWKNSIQLAGGLAAIMLVRNPWVKAIGITVGAIGAKGLLAQWMPEYFAGEDEYLIASDYDYMTDETLVMNGANSLVSAELLGTNNLLRGEYMPSYDAANDSGMGY